MTSFSYLPLQSRNTIPLLYSGGLEILFGNQSTVSIDVPAPKEQTEVLAKPLAKPLCRPAVPKDPSTAFFRVQLDIAHLLFWLRDNLLTERPELFLQGNTVYVYKGSCKAFDTRAMQPFIYLHTRVPQHLIHPLPMVMYLCTDCPQNFACKESRAPAGGLAYWCL